MNPYAHTFAVESAVRLCEERKAKVRQQRTSQMGGKGDIEPLSIYQRQRKTNPKNIVATTITLYYKTEWIAFAKSRKRRNPMLLTSIDYFMHCSWQDEVDALNNIIANQNNKCTRTRRVHGLAICLPISSVCLQSWGRFSASHFKLQWEFVPHRNHLVKSKIPNCRDLITAARNVIAVEMAEMLCQPTGGRI